MSFRKKRKRRRFDRPLCAAMGPDDGIDPRDDAQTGRRPVANRKAMQLCRQVAHALSLALAGFGDPALQDLLVLDVRPWPDSSRLMITVQSATRADVNCAELLQRLGSATSRLRQEVSAAIHRRRVPDLVFHVQAP